MRVQTIDRVPAVLLVEDMRFYPRLAVDDYWVSVLAEHLRAGHDLPPIVACRDTKVIIDGFHRRRAYLRVFGTEAEVPVEWHTYRDDAERFLDAVRLNAGHGKPFTRSEWTRVAVLAAELGIERTLVAEGLGVRVDVLEGRLERATAVAPDGRLEPLRPAVRPVWAGEQLTRDQLAANRRLGGYSVSFYCNVLIDLLRTGGIDRENARVMARLQALYEALDAFLHECADGVEQRA